MLEANSQVAVTLTAKQWEETLKILIAGPYHIVAPIIQAVTQQLGAAANAPMPAGKPANGEAAHPS